MKTIRILFALVAICLLANGQPSTRNATLGTFNRPPAAAPSPPVTDSPLFLPSAIDQGTRHDVTGLVGGVFMVGPSNIVVTALGRWVIGGNTQVHVVHLTDNGCADIITASVSTSGATTNQQLYVSITPTLLSSNTTYRLMSSEDSANAAELWYDQSATTESAAIAPASLQGAFFISGSCGLGAGNHVYVPVNALYHFQ